MHIVDSLYNITKNDNKESRYAYRMIKEDFFGGQAFGIEAERQDLVEGNVITIERDEIRKISNIEGKVKELLNLIYVNEVSPIHLVDILGEYVDNYVSDFNL
ncbi:DUF6514 family protein [Clostridium sp. CTA-7]